PISLFLLISSHLPLSKKKKISSLQVSYLHYIYTHFSSL
ncbi:unnamed protein product, partial [Brassica oleracea var. botrytis]